MDPQAADLNPYRSPAAVDVPYCEVAYFPNEPLEVRVMRSSTLYRRLRLEGQIQAEIEWDARGAIEHVNVNGRKVVGQMAFFSSIPHFEFDMYAGGRKFHVTIDLRTFLVYITTAFRLAIDG